MANSQGDRIAFATPLSSTCIVLNCILFVTVLDFCCVSIGDLTRDCLVFLKDRQVSSFGCFVFDSWVLRFRVLGASFSSFGCFALRSSFSSARNYLHSNVLKFANQQNLIPICVPFVYVACTVPWVPETFLAPFPVFGKSS